MLKPKTLAMKQTQQNMKFYIPIKPFRGIFYLSFQNMIY